MSAPRHLNPLPETTQVTLRDGTTIVVRALVPEDRALVAAAFDRLSDRSRFLRFFSPLPRLPKRTLDSLMDVDHVRHVALVAVHDEACIGVVRYVVDRDDPTVADLAITVIDAHQGRGLGRALMETISDVAAARGVKRLSLDIHPENRVMMRLVRSLGVRLGVRDGVMHGTLPVPLPLARPDAGALSDAA